MRVTLDVPMSLGDIAAAVGVTPSLSANPLIRAITTDSREAREGDLFVALKGRVTDGNEFITSATERGAFTLGSTDESDLRVADTEESLLAIAKYYKNTSLTSLQHTVAITGSVGKTTTKEFLRRLLSRRHKIHATEGNYNNTIGVPLAVLSAPCDTEILILELGMNSTGEIARLSKCINPTVGVITNIGTAHIGRLGSREKIAEAKLELICGMSPDSSLYVPYGEALLEGYGRKTFSTSSPYATVAVLGKPDVNVLLRGAPIGISPFLPEGHHHRECLAAALSAALEISDIPGTISSISEISECDTRARLRAINDFFILDDSYNASYESINAALYHLFALHGYNRKSVLLGDVLELGEFAEEIHLKIGRLLARFSPAEIYLYGDYAGFTARGALIMGVEKEHLHAFGTGNEQELANTISSRSTKGELILVKGSRGMHLEKIIEYIS